MINTGSFPPKGAFLLDIPLYAIILVFFAPAPMQETVKHLLRIPIVGTWVVLTISRTTLYTPRVLHSSRFALKSLMTFFRGALNKR